MSNNAGRATLYNPLEGDPHMIAHNDNAQPLGGRERGGVDEERESSAWAGSLLATQGYRCCKDAATFVLMSVSTA